MNMNNDATEFGSIVHRNLRRKKVGLGPLRFLSFLGITMGVLILMAMAAPSARAALLTYYDFEDDNLTLDSPGLQTTHIAPTGGFVSPADLGTGTNMNAVITPSTDHSLAVFAIFTTTASFTLGGLTTTGLTDVDLSFAIQGAIGSFTNLNLSYSTTGNGVNANYIQFASIVDLEFLSTYIAPSFL